MSGISNFGSLNSLNTLIIVTNKLPYDLRRRWVVKSVEIERMTSSIATLADLVKFVQNESLVVNSLFRKRNLSTIKTTVTIKPKPKFKISSFNTSASNVKSSLKKTNENFSKNVCWFCDESSHRLHDCKSFQAKSIKERFFFVKWRKLCHKCFSHPHRTPECKKVKACNIDGYKGSYHHTLLHFWKEKSKDAPSQADSSNATSSTGESSSEKTISCSIMGRQPHSDSVVYFCGVPVFIKNRDKECSTYAFLDQESSHTFCDRELIDRLQIDGTSSKIFLQTLNGVTTN